MVRVSRQHHFETGERFVEALERPERYAPVVQDLNTSRLERQRSVKAGKRFVESVQALKSKCPVFERPKMIGPRRQRPLEMHECVSVISRLVLQKPQQVSGIYMLRLAAEHTFVDRPGLVPFSGAVESNADFKLTCVGLRFGCCSRTLL